MGTFSVASYSQKRWCIGHQQNKNTAKSNVGPKVFYPRAQASRVIGERAKRARRYLVMFMEARDIYKTYYTGQRVI